MRYFNQSRVATGLLIPKGMSQLAVFFKGSDTELGVFYPAHYIIATFRNLDTAEHAAANLRRAGIARERYVVAPGRDFVDLMNEEKTLLGMVMTEVSRFIDTEAHYSDRDLKDAEHGAAILAVYCHDERAKDAAWQQIAPAQPIRARYYSLGAVEHLAGES